MGSLLLALLLLPAPPVEAPAAGAAALIRSIELDAAALLRDPVLLGAGTLALVLEAGREADFKLSEQDQVLAAGRLMPGENALRFVKPGLAGQSQDLAFLLELRENTGITRKTIRVIVTVEGTAAAARPGHAALSGLFILEMRHGGQTIGFRQKTMPQLINPRTGPVMPVSNPGLSGGAGRPPDSYSVSLIGLGLALAKHLIQKRSEKRLRAYNAEAQKKKVAVTLIRDGKEVPIVIELRVE